MIIYPLVIDRLTKGMFCSEIDWFKCDGTSNLKASEFWTSVNWLECVITTADHREVGAGVPRMWLAQLI